MTFCGTLYCPIRKSNVAALPEELVRQRFLAHMIQEKGFPAELIAVEQSLRLLPHLGLTDPRQIPDRRADIVCFAKGPDVSLSPLLAVECKAVKLTNRVIRQVIGYNHFIRAYFVVIVNQTEVRTGWYDQEKGAYVFVDHLPSYFDLMQSIGGVKK